MDDDETPASERVPSETPEFGQWYVADVAELTVERLAIDRRRLLVGALRGVGAGIVIAAGRSMDVFATPRWSGNPFTLGVASGDPLPDGAVLWTRLTPEPADPTYLGPGSIPVSWRVATDDGMRTVVADGVATAAAPLAHSVHVEVGGLQSGADYFYQFDTDGEESPVGHFRTAPAADASPDELQFAVVTCQDWSSGHYVAYRDMVDTYPDLDLVLHLGDYIYEGVGTENNRGAPTPDGFVTDGVDLASYRLLHTLYKLDPDLQEAHARYPFVAVWDDHEVANDYSGVAPEYDDPSAEFLARRAAAYQAYYEHMPLRIADARFPTWDLPIYRRLRYGRLADFTMLDDRQYRSDNPCGDGETPRCDEALTGDYSMLGVDQERWLAQGLTDASPNWNFFGQQLLIAELEHDPTDDDRYWNDAWDGYPAARTRLLDAVVGNEVRNPVFLTGDWHSTFVNDIKLDFKDQSSPAVATEFVTPAITSGGDGTPYGPHYGPMVPNNPHIRYYEGDRRGYFAATLTPSQARFDLRLMTSVEDPDGIGATEQTFFVNDGAPGAVV